jgi:CHASE2 domain-containing sensor protein
MPNRRNDAARDFRRMMKWIVVLAVLMVIGALTFEWSQDALTPHMAIATTLGVFFAMLLGAGLFALAFFSDKSGHDETVTRATTKQDEDANEG